MRIMLMKLPPFSLSFCAPVRSLGPETDPPCPAETDGPYRKLEMPAQRREGGGGGEALCFRCPLNGRCKSGAHKCTGRAAVELDK